jgi:hypothetical protein
MVGPRESYFGEFNAKTGEINMTVLRFLAFVCLGLAFSVGCGDSTTRSWEEGKPQASGTKKVPKENDIADNDDAAAGDSKDSKPSTNPHGMASPHGDMPMAGGSGETKVDSSGKLDLDNVHLAVPKSWVPKPHSQMLQAEFAIPPAEGDKQDGRLTISQLGGTLEDNVARWKQQFSKLDKENEEKLDASGTKIMLVDFAGTFNDSRSMMAPAVTRQDYRLLGAIFQIPGEEQLHFIKFYGPAKTMAARADEFKGFLRSLKVDK